MTTVPLAPSPPPRERKTGSDFDSLIAKRAQRMIAAGTHRNNTAVSTATTSSSSQLVKDPVRPVSGRRYPLEWDPRAVPLLTFAENEVRRTIAASELEYRKALMAAIHSTMVAAYHQGRIDALIALEREQRHIIGHLDVDGRERLWQGHEELIVTQQLKELDIPHEEAVRYLHRASVFANTETTDRLQVLKAETAEGSSHNRSDHTSHRHHHNHHTREVSDSSVSDKPQNPESEWVLGITYLITFDLVMLERKTRIAALREEHTTRTQLREVERHMRMESEKCVSSRRHMERCNYYREQRVKKASLELISDCLSSDLYEDWMQMSLTLMAAACIDEHHHKLMLWKGQLSHFDFEDRVRQFIKRESWHRVVEINGEYQSDVARVYAHHAVYTLLALEEEERRVWKATFATWIGNAPSLVRTTGKRLAAALKIQVFVRQVRQGLRGWRVTHRLIGSTIRQLRAKLRRVEAKHATLHPLLSKLESLGGCDGDEGSETIR